MAERDRVGGGLSDPGVDGARPRGDVAALPGGRRRTSRTPSPVLRLPNLPPLTRPSSRGRSTAARCAPGGADRRAHPRPLPRARAARRSTTAPSRGAAPASSRQRERDVADHARAPSSSRPAGAPSAAARWAPTSTPATATSWRAEVGARLSGMEFSNYYGIVPKGSSLGQERLLRRPRRSPTPTARSSHVGWSGASARSGRTHGRRASPRAGLRGPVFSILDRAPADARGRPCARRMPNFFMVARPAGHRPVPPALRDRLRPGGDGARHGRARARPTRRAGPACPGLWAAGDTAVARAARRRRRAARARRTRRSRSRRGTWSGPGRRPSTRKGDHVAEPTGRGARGSACGRAPPGRRRTSGARSRARCRREVAADRDQRHPRSGPGHDGVAQVALDGLVARGRRDAARRATCASARPRPGGGGDARDRRWAFTERAGAGGVRAACTSATTCPRRTTPWPSAHRLLDGVSTQVAVSDEPLGVTA